MGSTTVTYSKAKQNYSQDIKVNEELIQDTQEQQFREASTAQQSSEGRTATTTGTGSQSGTQTETQIADQIQKSIGTQEQVQTGKQSQQQVSTLLSSQTQSLLENLVASLGSAVGARAGDTLGINEAARDLQTRAGTAEEEILASITPIVAEARRAGELELKALQDRAARQAGGSTANLGVSAQVAEGRAALESKLASLQAGLELQARGTATQELQGAISALASGQQVNAQQEATLTNILGILKGATATQTGQAATETGTQAKSTQEATTSTEQKNTVSSLLENITKTSEESLVEALASTTERERLEVSDVLNKILLSLQHTEGDSVTRTTSIAHTSGSDQNNTTQSPKPLPVPTYEDGD